MLDLVRRGAGGEFLPLLAPLVRSVASQIEAMLGMQTYCVPVPYEYEQSGQDLFDTGNAHLRPSVTGFYGLV